MKMALSDEEKKQLQQWLKDDIYNNSEFNILPEDFLSKDTGYTLAKKYWEKYHQGKIDLKNCDEIAEGIYNIQKQNKLDITFSDDNRLEVMKEARQVWESEDPALEQQIENDKAEKDAEEKKEKNKKEKDEDEKEKKVEENKNANINDQNVMNYNAAMYADQQRKRQAALDAYERIKNHNFSSDLELSQLLTDVCESMSSDGKKMKSVCDLARYVETSDSKVFSNMNLVYRFEKLNKKHAKLITQMSDLKGKIDKQVQRTIEEEVNKELKDDKKEKIKEEKIEKVKEEKEPKEKKSKKSFFIKPAIFGGMAAIFSSMSNKAGDISKKLKEKAESVPKKLTKEEIKQKYLDMCTGNAAAEQFIGSLSPKKIAKYDKDGFLQFVIPQIMSVQQAQNGLDVTKGLQNQVNQNQSVQNQVVQNQFVQNQPIQNMSASQIINNMDKEAQKLIDDVNAKEQQAKEINTESEQPLKELFKNAQHDEDASDALDAMYGVDEYSYDDMNDDTDEDVQEETKMEETKMEETKTEETKTEETKTEETKNDQKEETINSGVQAFNKMVEDDIKQKANVDKKPEKVDEKIDEDEEAEEEDFDQFSL